MTAQPVDAVPVDAAERIVAAAVEAFAEHGYHATTTRDIAARAGLSPAGIYVHHPSKAALLARISLDGHRAALLLVESSIARAGDSPAEQLRAVVADFTAWHARNHRMARVVQYELAALAPADRAAVVALRRRTQDLVTGVLQRGIADGALSADQPSRVARAVLSLGIDVARWFDPAGRDTPEGLGELYAGLALRMVGA